MITGQSLTIHATAQGTTVSVANSCQAPGCTAGQASQGSQITTNIITTPGTHIRTDGPTVALHEYVYKNDFAGFREKMRDLDRKENQPSLIGSLQSTDDKVSSGPGTCVELLQLVLVRSVTPAYRLLRAGPDDITPIGLCWTAR
jgi:hypothetical protein